MTLFPEQLLLLPATKDWIHRLYSLGESDGSKLVEDLGSPREGKPGLSDNCSTADRILDELVDRGCIIPVRYNPSQSQRFFGVGGRPPGRMAKPNSQWRGSHTYPQEWRFRANYDSLGFLEYLGVRIPDGAVYEFGRPF